jgi:ABC-type phosphate/phosphonate transport system substrate-binding protein
MAENAEPFCAAVADHLTEELHIAVEYVNDGLWQERERRFDAGVIQILWLCGLPYVEKADQCGLDTELLAVPVPVGERYRGRPVYFSDIIVRNDSQYESLFDLRGARWAYNERRSHSGYNVVRAYLAEFAQHQEFFGAAIESGAHSASLEMVLSGAVDGAAIDSTVLEWYFAQDDERAARLRVIDTLGPSPIPPWVVSTRVAEPLRAALRAALLRMGRSVHGRAALQTGCMERFVEAVDGDYDPIRRMAQAADRVRL